MKDEQELKLYSKKAIKPHFAWLFNVHSLFYYTLFLILVGFLYFSFALVTEQFTTPYGGDFCIQGMTFSFNFYDTWWTFFKTGKFPMWNENIYLGADSINANTFYGLFSPFTFPLLFFPRSWIPHVMAIMSILRLVVGALFFRLYLRYMGVSERSSRVFAIAYAFSGWISYYLWFNSFYEVLTFLPLVFLGIEKVIKEQKIWILGLGLFLLCISNYFYMLTAGIFGVLYAGFRYFQTLKTRSTKDNFIVLGLGVLGFAVGFGMTAFATLPAIIAGMNIPRAVENKYLTNLIEAFQNKDFKEAFSLIFYKWDNDYQALYPVISFFYPTISDRFVALFEKGFDNVSSGLYMTSPAIIMLFASMYLSHKERKFSHFIAIGFIGISLFVPFVYYLIGSFSIMYGRWEIVVPMFALTYAALNFDRRREIPWYVIVVSGVLELALTIGVYFIADEVIKTGINDIKPIGPKVFVLVYEIIITILSTCLLAGFWHKPKKLYPTINSIVVIEVVAMGIAVANIHGLSSYENTVYGGKESFKGEREIVSTLMEREQKENGNSFYRIFSTTSTDYQANLQMAVGYNGSNTFHTFYNQNTADFNYMMGLMNENGWGGGEYNRRYLLGQFLGYKYMVTKNSQTSYYHTQDGKRIRHTYEPNVPLGYTKIDETDEFRVYKNDYHIDFGLGYDTLYRKGNNSDKSIKTNEFYDRSSTYTIRNDEALFKGAILNNEDVEEIENQYPGLFNIESNAPTLEMNYINFDEQYYLGSGNFDPSNPNRYLTSEYHIDKYGSKFSEIVDENNKLRSNDYRGKFTIVLTPDLSLYDNPGENGMYYALRYPLRTSFKNFNATVFLISGDDEHVERYDNLNWTKQRISYYEFYRGFYSKEKLKKIIIVVNGDTIFDRIRLYGRNFSDYINLFNNIQENRALKNAKKDVNSYSFETDFNKEKFVVTQLAYNDGFRVKITTKDGEILYPKIYNAQGGFVSFVAPKGQAFYEINYKTPQISTGICISAISLILYTGGIIGMYFVEKSRKKKKII